MKYDIEQLLEAGEIIQIYPEGYSMSVSYTHLDVYKRQIRKVGVICGTDIGLL